MGKQILSVVSALAGKLPEGGDKILFPNPVSHDNLSVPREDWFEQGADVLLTQVGVVGVPKSDDLSFGLSDPLGQGEPLSAVFPKIQKNDLILKFFQNFPAVVGGAVVDGDHLIDRGTFQKGFHYSGHGFFLIEYRNHGGNGDFPRFVHCSCGQVSLY